MEKVVDSITLDEFIVVKLNRAEMPIFDVFLEEGAEDVDYDTLDKVEAVHLRLSKPTAKKLAEKLTKLAK